MIIPDVVTSNDATLNDLVNRVMSGNAVLFLGSGFSASAYHLKVGELSADRKSLICKVLTRKKTCVMPHRDTWKVGVIKLS